MPARLPVLTLTCLALTGLCAEEIEALPALPPESRPLQLAAPASESTSASPVVRDMAGIADDLQALRRAVERVETTLRLEQQPGTGHQPADHAEHGGHAAAAAAETGPGTEVASDRFGGDRLMARTWSDGRCLITAAIQDEPAEVVVREIALLAGATLDTQSAGSLRRPISVHVRELPWTCLLYTSPSPRDH
jgi:hypothetical protein